MYVSLEEAKEEVWKRWNDVELHQKVLEYVGELPKGFGHEPWAVMVRHIATPNFEFIRFSELAQKTGLKPRCQEYTGDKFCTWNPDKLLLGKIAFFHGKGKRNGDKITSHQVIAFQNADGKSLQAIKTVWGESLIGFHHSLVSAKLPDFEVSDITGWYRKMGSRPEFFYHRLLALFICNGILFENFLGEGEEEVFTRTIVIPAIQRVKNHFGLKPLIVRLLPAVSEADQYWCWYPGHLEAEVKALLAGRQSAASLQGAEYSVQTARIALLFAVFRPIL